MVTDMAAAADWLSSLPGSWGFGITQGGRIYFINEEAKSTTWLHPVTGEAVLTGHRKTPDLPTGWEEGFTFEGARYYINHNERKVTCKHPVSGQPSQDNCIFVVNDHPASTMSSQEKKDRTVSVTSDTSNCNALPAAPHTSPLTRTSRSLRKVHNFGKRSNSIKRNPNAPVTVRNWLYKKANSGMKLWKKRWFVLSDLCLFYYRDEKEEGVLGSILLPSFQISSVTPEDHINRMFAFKASHPNMRTYYFCTDTGRDTELWIKAMKEATLAHSEPSRRTEMSTFENLSPLEMNHVPNHRLLIRPDITSNQRNKEVSRVDERKAREAERYGFQKDGQDRPLTKINSVRHQPGLPDYDILSTAHYRSAHTNGPDTRYVETQGHISETDGPDQQRFHTLHTESERVIQRTNSMLQLEQWIRAQRDKGPDEDSRGVVSYQTLPRNMPSYRSQVVPRYPEGYRTLPRNPKPRPESLCSTAGVGYDRTLPPMCSDEKRRSVRDDTMWQLYEWQQRQFYNKQTTLRRHSSLTSPKTMIQISEQTLHSIPLSPSHGSISGYHTYSPHRPYRSEVSSPVQRGDVTIDRRQKTLPNKHATFLADRRSVPAGLSLQPITMQGLQDKTPEELTLLLIKLRRQQAELGTVREHALAQLLRLKQQCSPKDEILSRHLQRNLLYVDYQMKENEPLISMVHAMIENSALRPHLYQQMSQEDCRRAAAATAHNFRSEDVDVDAKLSQLCEQDKVVQALEQKLQQLHKEKYTLEQALLSASQEIEMNAENLTAIQSVVLQRDELQSGLLSTCREVSRATTELERAWREYERLERDVTIARNQMREQLNRLGEVQTESAGIQRAQMQKEIWRIQDVMEGLSKHKEQRRSKGNGDADMFPSGKILHEGPDYRLYKSEPELTTVTEVDESNGDDRVDTSLDIDAAGGKGSHFPVGVVPPRTKSPPLESTTIASYVTLRKNKKLEPKLDRPRSAVEHLCIADSGVRHRMTLEEQLERMRRHQQASLKEKRKGLSFLGTIEPSPSFSRENSLKERQTRRREEAVLSNIQDIENAMLEENLRNRESPAQEITRLKEAAITSDAGSAVKVENSATTPEPKTKEDAKEDAVSEVEPADAVQTFGGNSVSNRKVESIQRQVSAGEQERAGILFSYEFSADTLRRHTSLDAGNLSLPEPQSAQPQLTEGSHFMCV